jgi:hypothetical protein
VKDVVFSQELSHFFDLMSLLYAVREKYSLIFPHLMKIIIFLIFAVVK